MANDTNIKGLWPVDSPNGVVRVNYYRANTALAIFRGQPVVLNNSGSVQTVAVGQNQPMLGSVVGFLDLTRAGLPSAMTSFSQSASLPAGTDAFVAVADSPEQFFLVQEDTGGSALTVSNIGNTADFTYIDAGTGNTTTGYSNALLDRSTAAASTGGALQIVGLFDIKNQDGTDNAAGDNAKWVVRIANHQLNNTVISVSV